VRAERKPVSCAPQVGAATDEEPDLFVEENEGPVVHQLTTDEYQLVMKQLAHWAISQDGRSRGKCHFASTTIQPKIPCLKELFQAPKSVILVGEMDGKDNNKNMKERMGPFWAQLEQFILNEKKVTFHYEGRALQVRLPALGPAPLGCCCWYADLARVEDVLECALLHPSIFLSSTISYSHR